VPKSKGGKEIDETGNPALLASGGERGSQGEGLQGEWSFFKKKRKERIRVASRKEKIKNRK